MKLAALIFFAVWLNSSNIAQKNEPKIQIIKTDHIFATDADMKNRLKQDQLIYWIFDPLKKVIRIVREPKMQVMKLHVVEKYEYSDCDYRSVKYYSSHSEMENFYIELFYQIESNDIAFVRLTPRNNDTGYYYLANDDSKIDQWQSCYFDTTF